MQKSIQIELLQPVESTPISNNLLSNYSFATNTIWDTTAFSGCSALWSIGGGKMSKTSTADCARFKQTINLTEGFRYQVRVNFKNYNRSNSLLLANHGIAGANVTLVNSSTMATGEPGNTSSSLTIKVNFTQGSSNTSALNFYAHGSTTMDINYVQLFQVSNVTSAVFGVLDGTTTEDFPLALTFSINDPTNIDNRKGAFSKTFQIPATSNNNQVLKNFNIPNSTLKGSRLFEKIPCRMLVGELFSISGLIQIQDVERINDKPILYSCIFLGDNLGWSTLLEAKYLSDLQLANSTNLEISAKSIIDTFYADNCESSTARDGTVTVNDSPIVYPVTLYGQANQFSPEKNFTLQLFRTRYEEDYISQNSPNSSHTGCYNLGSMWGASDETVPVVDWRPQVWIKNMIYKIFSDVGYKISSLFMESDDFKRLVYLTPNFLFNAPQTRFEANSFMGNFKDDSVCTPASLTNLQFYDRSKTIITNVSNSSGYIGYQSGTQLLAPTILLDSGSCSSANGSRRFQPQNGVSAQGGTINQQDTTMGVSTSSLTGDTFSSFTIGEAGFYTISTSNISYEVNVPKWVSGSTVWTGAGVFNNSSYPGIMEMWGGVFIQVLAPGYSNAEDNWYYGSKWSNYDNTSQNLGKAYSTVNFTQAGNLNGYQYTGYFNKGDRVRLGLEIYKEHAVYKGSTNWTANGGQSKVTVAAELYGTQYGSASSSNGTVKIEMFEPEKPAYACTYNLQDVLPNNQKQLDFVKGIAHSFNLQFYTSESEKTVYIEPFTQFYLPPKSAIDWTYKLDRGQPDKTSFLKSDFTRRLVFKYQTDDKDYNVKRMSEGWFQNTGDNYPHIKDLDNTYPAGETIFENPFFAGNYDSQTNRIGEGFLSADSLGYPSENMYATSLVEIGANGQKGYEFMPRMLLYNKRIMPSVQYPQWQGYSVDTLGYPYNASSIFSFAKNQVSDVTSYTYGTFPEYTNFGNAVYTSSTFIDRHNYSNQFGLSYGNYWAKDYDPTTNAYTAVGNQVGKGLYSRYYQPMIDNMLNNPKLRECYIDLKIKDILNLDFRKLVYIDGVYYRLIKVVDYKPHLNIPTKVELHQWQIAEGSSLPQEGVWVNPAGTGIGTTNDDGSVLDDGVIMG